MAILPPPRCTSSKCASCAGAIGYQTENVVNSSYLAWTDEPAENIEAIAALTASMGFGGVQHAAEASLAVREIAEGHHGRAHERLQRIEERPFLHTTNLHLADMVEAAARSGHLDVAQRTAAMLAGMAAVNPTAWLGGLNERCQALLAGDAAEKHYQAAIERLATAEAPADLGRAHLLYGEWLRRRKRRRQAREQLRAAVTVFDRIEAPAFARRARAELAATGEPIADKEVVGGVEMSPREATVARMAAAGETNADIAATLFITANTVDYHLRKVFQKLGVSSRRQLQQRFDSHS
ncbi:helix-turn-helix transcriptional regulator [Mycolicibacterium sp. BiH015]|uniref:helix-turn-helix transcriptional regulator n=1 Tax=Mycolicibacterium sp. BiH015 TaxID=3018808 RepID=UPI0022E151A3|nr:helix-turn-helix transcriptional regulator [Mycolicibacterium sp. BiH015]MDA2891962.1 helix-turn-helix transcriptional regulator [Mycolicibacterium sp. BiH015]